MLKAFYHHLFGDASRALQLRADSRSTYAGREAGSPGDRDELTARELTFLTARDSFYMASVTSDGWPYVQHRGGRPGFVKALGGNRIGVPDYPGNRQFISLGNVIEHGRVALFAMDYVARRRLKLIAHAHVVTATEDPTLLERMAHPASPRVETVLVCDVVGFDWNCPQFIEPRYTQHEMDRENAPLREENSSLRSELARLKGVAS